MSLQDLNDETGYPYADEGVIMITKSAPVTSVEVKKPERTKGQIFKDRFGISKTFKRNMYKAGFGFNGSYSTPNEQKAYRKHRQNVKKLKNLKQS